MNFRNMVSFLASVALMAGVFSAVAAAPAEAATRPVWKPTLSVNKTTVKPGERVKLTSRARKKRDVMFFQRHNGRKWVTFAKRRPATRKAVVRPKVRGEGKTRFRVVEKRWVKKGKKGKRRVLKRIGVSKVQAVRAAIPAPIPITTEADRLQFRLAFGNLLHPRRLSLGLPISNYNSCLNDFAQAHTDEMVAKGKFEHSVHPDFLKPFGQNLAEVCDGLIEVNDKIKVRGENIAIAHGTTPEAAALAVFNGWVASPAHRITLDDCYAETSYRMGVGVVRMSNGSWWATMVISAEDVSNDSSDACDARIAGEHGSD